MAETMTIGFPGGARVSAEYEGFTVETDQPAEQGGENSAPAPFDYFLISIGTCVGYYVLKFLQKRELPTEGVRLELSTVKDPERKMHTEVRIRLRLPKSFPKKYEKAIVKAADGCSVKKHILTPPAFVMDVEIED